MSDSNPIPQVDIRKALAEIEKCANEKNPNNLLLASKILSLSAAAQNENQIIPDDALRVLSQQTRRLVISSYCLLLIQVLDQTKQS